MQTEKKSEERLVMQYFRERYADFPKGKLVSSESPDFIVRQSRKRSIGIELTRLDYIIKDHPDLWREQLIGFIKKKENKLRLYKKKRLAEYWLIMSVEDVDLNDIRKQIAKKDFLFERVFLFHLFTGQITEL